MNVTSYLIEAHICRKVEPGVEFLLIKRAPGSIYPGLWQPVTGKIENGETALQAASRELLEETGLSTEHLWVAPFVNSFYDHYNDIVCMVPVFFITVEGDPEITLSEEHDAMQWVSSETAKTLLSWPGQRRSVDSIVEHLTHPASALQFTKVPLQHFF